MSRHNYERHLLGHAFAQTVEFRKPKELAFLRCVEPYVSPRVTVESRHLLKGNLVKLYKEAVKVALESKASTGCPASEVAERARTLKAGTKRLCDITDGIAEMYKRDNATGQQVMRELLAEVRG